MYYDFIISRFLSFVKWSMVILYDLQRAACSVYGVMPIDQRFFSFFLAHFGSILLSVFNKGLNLLR